MPDILSKETVIFTLQRMGYELVASEGDNVLMIDPEYSERPLGLIFSIGALEWADLRMQFEYEGVNTSVFLSELESAG